MLDSLIYAMESDPRSCGQRHPAEIFSRAEIWIAQLPALINTPAILVLYEIFENEGVIVLWNVSLLPTRHVLD